jgi:hypothetical protein
MILPAIGGEHHPGLCHGLQDRPIQTFVVPGPVEALPVPVLPGTSRVDVERYHLVLRQPTPHRQRDELRPTITADELGRALRGDQTLQDRHDSRRWQRGGDFEGAPFPRELVHDRQPLQGHPLETVSMENVLGPDVARMRRLHRASHTLYRSS